MAEIEVAALDELPPGTMRLVPAGSRTIGVYNCGGRYFAIEDRCSHDDGPLCEGEFDCGEKVAVCPRHGARFDIRDGRVLSFPAITPIKSFPVKVEGSDILIDLVD